MLDLSANTLCFRLLLAIIVLAPLPLASNRPLPWTGLALATGLLLTLWTAAAALGRVTMGVQPGKLYMAALPYCLCLAWVLIQSLPGAPPDMANPLWAEAGRALGSQDGAGLPGRITIDGGRTRTGLMLLLCYGAIFFLSAQLGRNRSREAIVFLALTGVAYALYGLVLWMLGSETILWMDKWAYKGALTSTFVNRNAYAAYAGIGLICCMALAADAAAAVGGRLRDRMERVMVKTLPWVVAGLVLGMALVLTQSRAGLLLTIAGLIVLGICLRVAGVLRGRMATAFMLVLLALLLLILFLGGNGTLGRLAETGLTDEARLLLYRTTFSAFLDAPMIGQGLGSFPAIFPIYRDAGLTMLERFDHAHSLHLELLMDLGVAGTLLLYLSVLVILGRCAAGLVRRRRSQIYPAVALAVTALLGLHGIVDFSLQMPAVAATYAFLLGLGFTQSFPGEDNGDPYR